MLVFLAFLCLTSTNQRMWPALKNLCKIKRIKKNKSINITKRVSMGTNLYIIIILAGSITYGTQTHSATQRKR